MGQHEYRVKRVVYCSACRCDHEVQPDVVIAEQTFDLIECPHAPATYIMAQRFLNIREVDAR